MDWAVPALTGFLCTTPERRIELHSKGRDYLPLVSEALLGPHIEGMLRRSLYAPCPLVFGFT